MPRVVSANWFSENVSHLCVIGYERLASLLHLAPPYPPRASPKTRNSTSASEWSIEWVQIGRWLRRNTEAIQWQVKSEWKTPRYERRKGKRRWTSTRAVAQDT